MTNEPAALRQLAEDYWQGVLRRNPILATFIGDHRYDNQLSDVGPEARADEQAELQALLTRLDQIDELKLELEDRITASMLRLSLQSGLDGLRLRLDSIGVDQMDGPQVWLPELLNWHPTQTAEQIDQLITRYRAFPRFMDQYLDNLSDGVREGKTSPEIAVERVSAQVEALLELPADQSALSGGGRLAAPELGKQLPGVVRDSVLPAYEKMVDFLRGYTPRPEPGIWCITDGPEIYALQVRQHTTTELTPEELHQIGRDELESIHAEMRVVMRELGDTTSSIRQFTERLTHEPSNLPRSRQDLLTLSEQLLRKAEAALPRGFGRLPRTPCVVKEIEDFRERDAPAAYYFQPAADGSRPGTYYVNTFEPHARPLHTMPALAFHEGVPGHHLQIALAQETEGLPAFRRLSAGWLANAFVEGWALYTERLADELGLYPDPLARFGMLGYQAWRACRLVVDTGIHAMHWTRQQAIEFFFDNVGLTERETINEVDRYIVWPGQALAYKVGQREIERTRRQLEQQQGDRFDLRAFHDALLSHAAVPLSTLPLIVTTG